MSTMSERDVKYLDQIGKHTLLTKEEEIQYAHVIRKNETGVERDYAVEKMVIHNQLLVIKKSHTYHRLAPSIPVMDFFGAGNHGLIKAINAYDPDKYGTRFSTFATQRITNPMRRMINHIGHVNVPYYLRQLHNKYFKLIDSGETDDKEIMKALDINESMLEKLRTCEVKTVFLDAVDEDGQSLSDAIADEAASSPIANADKSQLLNALHGAVDKLDEREQYIVLHRLLTNDVWTLERISKDLKITKERVRQIQNEAVGKLKWILKEKGVVSYVPNL